MGLSELLLSKDTKRIPFSPELASVIGLNECIFLTQLQYWISIKGESEDRSTIHDGRVWVYNTAKQWAEQFPFMSTKTFRRTVAKLKDMGIVLTGRFNKKGYDKTLWYTIDYEALNKYDSDKSKEPSEDTDSEHHPVDKMTTPCGQSVPDRMDNVTTPSGQSVHYKRDNLSIPCGQNVHTNTIDYYIYNNREYIYNNGSKSTEPTENAPSQSDVRECSSGSDPSLDIVRSEFALEIYIRNCFHDLKLDDYAEECIVTDILYFYRKFHENRGEYHPLLKMCQMRDVIQSIYEGTEVVTDYSPEVYVPMIDDYFATNFTERCDYHINHFVSGSVRDMRWYDTMGNDNTYAEDYKVVM